MRDARRKPGDLLHGTLDREAHRPHGGVDAVRCVDCAVRHEIDLVELRVHPIHRPPGLVDHGQNLVLRSPDERGKPPESSAQTDEGVGERQPDREEEDGQRELGEVVPAEGEEWRHVYGARS